MKYDNIFTKSYLTSEYVKKNRSINSIAMEHGVKRSTVKAYLLRNNILLHLPDYTKRSGYCNGHWGGYEEIPLSYWNNTVSNARKRNLEFSVTIQQAWNLFLSQNRKCSLSGLPINFGPRKNTLRHWIELIALKDMLLAIFSGFIKT